MAYKVFTAGELREVAPANGDAKLFRSETERYWTNVVHKDHPEKLSAEMHDAEADLYVVLEGESDLYLGGAIVNTFSPEPGQHRGSGLDGAEKFTIRTGDVIVIPEGVPHMLDVRTSRIVYLVVKIDVNEAAPTNP